MYLGKPLTAQVSSSAALAAEAALLGRLTVYAGAGLSAAPPTSLPGAGGLASKIYHLLESVINFETVSEWDLLAVADRVELEPRGLEMLHAAIARVAAFDTARPNFAHKALGLLICEGATTVLEANYDSCIERGAQPEQIPVVVSDVDRQQVSRGALLKVHGCISRPHSMLATTAELLSPPLYAITELSARLSDGSVTFIGLGSPADYVKDSVTQFVTRVSSATLTLVDPKVTEWEESGWNAVAPELAPANRVAMDAEAFCDELLRFYVLDILRRLADSVGGLDHAHPQRLGCDELAALLKTHDAVWTLTWLRRSAWQFAVGTPVITSGRVLQGLMAISMLTSGTSIDVRAGGVVWLPDVNTAVLLVVAGRAPSGSVTAIEAEHRAMDARTEGRIPEGSSVVVVCCGQSGGLGADEVFVPRGSRLVDHVDAFFGSDHIIRFGGDSHLIDSIFEGSFGLLSGEALIDIS